MGATETQPSQPAEKSSVVAEINPTAAAENKQKAKLSQRLASKVKRLLGREADPNRVLKDISLDNFDREKHSGDKTWKNATERGKGFLNKLKTRRLTPAAKNWAHNHQAEVQQKVTALNADTESTYGRVSRREQRKNLARAIVDSRQQAGEGPLDTLTKTQQSQEFQKALQDKLYAKSVDKGGRPLTKREQIRAERELLVDKIPEANKSQTEQKSRKAEAEQANNNRIKNSADFRELYTQRLKEKNADGSRLDPEIMAKYSQDAQQEAMTIIKNQEQQERSGDEARVIENGGYHEAVAKILLEDPSMTTNPDLREYAMDDAISDMKYKEAQAKAKAEAEEQSGPEDPADSGNPIAEATTTTQSADILKSSGLTPEAIRAITEALKSLNETNSGNEIGPDPKGTILKTVLAVIGALISAGVIGATNIRQAVQTVDSGNPNANVSQEQTAQAA